MDASDDTFDTGGGDFRGQFPEYLQRVARNRFCGGEAIIGVVFVFEGQGAVRLDAVREVRIAAGNQHQIAIKRVAFERAGAVVEPGMKSSCGFQAYSTLP